jgi:MFS family permease
VSTLAYTAIPAKNRSLIISASLLALFLGALDALVMSAAMPTIVADLGGLHLYSWVYSAYLLARTVSLPIFGKLADIYRTKPLYVVSILIFIVASLAAGFAKSMLFLIVCRASAAQSRESPPVAISPWYTLCWRISLRPRSAGRPFPWQASSGVWRAF